VYDGRSERGKKAVGRSALSRIQTLVSIRLAKNLASLASQFDADANRQFQFQKRRQLFIRRTGNSSSRNAVSFSSADEPLSIIAVCVGNPDRKLPVS